LQKFSLVSHTLACLGPMVYQRTLYHFFFWGQLGAKARARVAVSMLPLAPSMKKNHICNMDILNELSIKEDIV